MNDELKARLVQYLDAMGARFAKAEDFAVEQIPDVAQQWLAWEFWSCVFFDAVVLVVAVLSFFLHKASVVAFGKKKAKNDPNDDGSFEAALAVLFLIASAGCILWSFYFGYKGIKVTVAPKVVLIEKIAELARGKQ